MRVHYLLLGLAAIPMATFAQDDTRTIRQAEKQALEADANARALSRKANAVDERVQQARQAQIDTAKRIQANERRATKIEQRIETLKTMQKQQRSKLAERQGEIARLLAALQTLSRRPTGLVLLQPENAVTTARVSALLNAVQPILAARTAGLKTELDHIRALHAQLDDARAKLAQAEAALSRDVARLETMQATSRKERDRLDAAADKELARAQQLASRALDLRGLASAIENVPSTANRKPAIRRGKQPDPETIVRLDYHLPATGVTVLGFGQQNRAGVRARGMTLSTPDNAQIIAPAAGRVAYAGTFRTYGEIVIIEHDDRLLSMIAGLKRVDVGVGETVSAGTPIGKMGAAKPRLYLELRADGRPVNPEFYINAPG